MGRVGTGVGVLVAGGGGTGVLVGGTGVLRRGRRDRGIA